MAVKRFSTSFISESGQDKSSNFIANYSPAIDEMELIERVRVGSGGTSAIVFDEIPQTYQHLQLRGILRGAVNAVTDDAFVLRFNNDSGSNYAHHRLFGDGTTVTANAGSSQTLIDYTFFAPGATATENVFGAYIVDILDYTNTTKNTTLRELMGHDRNGAGRLYMISGLWNNTNAITRLDVFNAGSRNAVEHSTLSLYGVKA